MGTQTSSWGAPRNHMLPASCLLAALIMIGSCFPLCAGQCFLNPSLSTRPAEDRIYRTDEMNLQSIFISVLDFVQIVKDEFWVMNGNHTITSPGDGSCAILGVGQSLQYLTTQGKVLLSDVPILTDVLKVSSNKFVVPSSFRSVYLNVSQFDKLIGHLDLNLHLVASGPPQLFLFKDRAGLIHLETFDIAKTNACIISPLAGNIHHGLQNTMQLVRDVLEKVQTVFRFFGSNYLFDNLGICLQIKNVTLQSLMSALPDQLDYCVQSSSNFTTPRLVRRSNTLSYILGEGAELSAIESSLKDSIIHFNANFEKVKIFDSQVIESFSRLESDIAALANIEISLQEQISDLTLFTRLQDIRLQYLLSRIQHESTLHRLLTESKLIKNLNLLERSLFGRNICQLGLID